MTEGKGEQGVEYISYMDQALLLARRAAGHEPVGQMLWIYDRPVDVAGLRRFQGELARGLLGRRITRSRLPVGRHRWATHPGISVPLEIAPGTVSRDALYEWADAQVDLPLDPEDGPGWRLAATALDGGGWLVSLVVSHCIADGRAIAFALATAAAGGSVPQEGASATAETDRPVDTQPRGASTIAADLRRLWTDLPEVGGALRTAAAGVRRDRAGAAPGMPRAAVQSEGGDELVSMPTVGVVLDQAEWDARAAALGGNRLPLIAALAARLGALAGRERDGAVCLLVPVDARSGSETEGGNVVSVARVAVAPDGLARDLGPIRVELRRGITAARMEPDPVVHLLPLVPFVPGALYARLADRTLGFTRDLPVSCSSLGDLDPLISCADGTQADYLLFRGVDRRVSAGSLARRGGVLSVLSGTINGRLSLTVVGWQTATLTTRGDLHRLVSAALDEFGLTGTLI